MKKTTSHSTLLSFPLSSVLGICMGLSACSAPPSSSSEGSKSGGSTSGGSKSGGSTSGGSTSGGSTSGGGGAVTTSTNTSNGIFPSDNAWNQDISGAEVDPDSAAYIAEMAPSTGMHPDFSNIVDGNYGIPYMVVNADQAMMPINFTDYADESDPGPYPIPLNAPVENGSDQHVIGVDVAHHMLYELFTASAGGSGWDAACGAKFDMTSNAERTEGWTSADAAGLPIFPGLVRADEVIDAGEIRHALRFTMVKSQAGYVEPARHFASNSTDPTRPPMGLRVRLKASVDISGAGPQAKVILTALKKYGMLFADNGSNWYISGSPDARWDDDDLHTLGSIKGSDFEVVKHGPIGT
ncbi:MAG: hypothetical protein ABI321_13440, partial [Polyangia bacterium]